MSKELNPINGQQEVVTSVADKTVDHRNTQLHLTAFSGGRKRGVCIQLGLTDGDHIQLTKKDALQLRNELNRFLEGDY